MTFSDCADTTTPSYWLGRPGDLVAIRMPDEGYTRVSDDHGVVHDLLAGAAVDRSLYEQRTWSVVYDMIGYATQLLVEQIRTRQRGLGPYVWIDPHTVNFMTQNQSSGTDAWLSTAGFTATGTGEALSSSTSVTPVRGQRSLAWSLSPVVTGSGGGVLLMSTPYGPSGWATPPSQGWTMTGQLRGGGADPTVTVTPHLTWLDGSGTILGTAAGSTAITSSGAWTSFTVTGTAPSTAVYVIPRLVVSPATVSGSAVVYVDELQLDMRIDTRGPRAWQPGQGQPRVSVTATRELVTRLGRTSWTYTLRELSASS
jgi:hypothetical protein